MYLGVCLLGLNYSNQPNREVVTGTVEELLKLDCGDYSSLPEATVTWSKIDCVINQQLTLGENVVTSVETGSLYLRRLTKSHEGCYQCGVANSVTGTGFMGSYVVEVNG